jgi:hypothetical protein
MSNLSDYRASIRRLIEADDTNEAFQMEGFTAEVTVLVRGSKSFIASRSFHTYSQLEKKMECDIPPHRQKKPNLT